MRALSISLFISILFFNAQAIDRSKMPLKVVKVIDLKTREPIIGAEIQLRDTNGNVLQKYYTDAFGIAAITRPVFSNALVGKKIDDPDAIYLQKSFLFSAFTGDTLVVELEKLHKSICGCCGGLQLYFKIKSAEPDAADVAVLYRVLKLMKDNPKIEIEISGHADLHNESKIAESISRKRAFNAAKWLIKHGIKNTRIICGFYGCKHLVNKCSEGIPCTDAENRENRRVEFKILKF